MTLLSNFRIACQVFLSNGAKACTAPITFLAVALLTTTSFAQQPPGMPTSDKPCNEVNSEHLAHMVADLKAVNLYIHFPSDLEHALDCHEREIECAKHDVVGERGNPEGHAEEIARRLKDLNSNFPPALYPANMDSLFRPMVKKLSGAFLPHDSSCQPPEPWKVNPYRIYGSTFGLHDVLNIVIDVTLETKANPHIVILTRTIVRRMDDDKELIEAPYSMAMPLDASEEDFRARLDRFAHDVMNGIQITAPVE